MLTTNLYFQKIGTGFPLIMLHGNGEDHTSLLTLAKDLSTHFEIYLIDSSGHGQSPGEIHISYDEIADDLLYFLNAHHIDKAHVFGYSDGAIVALKATVKSPDRFTKLVLCGMNIEPEGMIDIEDLKAANKKEKNPLLQLMLEGPVFNHDYLKALSHHIQLFFGEYDVIKKDHQQLIHQLLTNSELIIMNQQTHGSYIMNNNLLANQIISFLKD